MNSSISNSDARASLTVFFTVLLSGLLLAVASEWLLRREVLPQDDFSAHKRLFQNADQRDAAFGDSHVARGLVPKSGAVNLAYPSEGIAHIALKARAYFADKTPATVLLPADPHLFSSYRLENRPHPDYLDELNSSADPPWDKLLILDPRYRSRLAQLWLRYLLSGGELVSKVEILPNGAMLSPGDLSAPDSGWRAYASRDRVRLHRTGASKQVEAEKRIFSRLLDDLAEKGARICLVTFPLSPDYRSAMKATYSDQERSDWHESLAFFDAEARRVGGRYVNLHAEVQDRALFRDVDHLNSRGALIYSKEINRRCSEIPAADS
ncbi:hypothetical protein [Labrenzia sp. OB1]|uniref:hypothetical protein n=1 Tax=Labrenzia sp. OB1 TaxID=1561204 RepID=UPI0007B20671|nr:hypothetical protein [Labrenzia sp. OB1]KZM51822.1 hypothetical protein OA90_00460 [Labrenzia sp. OB1]